MKQNILYMVIVLFASTVNAHAQQEYKVMPKDSKIKIAGTSTLHDWDMTVEDFKGDISAVIGNPAITIKKVNFSVISSTISSQNSIMDRKTRNALKVKEYPEIRFRMTMPLKILTQGDTFNGIATGELFIAGKIKTVNLPFNGKTTPQNIIHISGAKKIDMTEFGIEPPTAILGTLKTGKDVTVFFEISLKQHDNEFNASLK